MIRVFVIILASLLAACAPSTVKDVRFAEPGEDLVWPGPPQKARIRYLYSFSEPGHIGIRPGIMKRLVQFVAGRESQAMLRPYAVAADDEMIAVVDPGLRLVHLFMMKESRYEVIRDAGGESFKSPIGISLAQDAIYVADSAAGAVFVFNRKGQHTRSMRGLMRPTGIAFHASSQRLYVTDTMENEIIIFDSNGLRVGQFGSRGVSAGEFNFPTSLAVVGNTLLVNDTLNFRVQVFTLDGKPLVSFGEIGDGSGQFALSKGLGVNGEGHIYVSDALSNYIQIFDSDGRFLLSFGGMGAAAGQFKLPAGVHVFSDTIFIADSQNGRVQVFEYLGGDEG